MKANHYVHGSNNVICDRCGFKRKAQDVREDGDKRGLMVCKDTCWDARQPQRMVKAKHDDQKPKVSRPEPTDNTPDTSGWITPDSVPDGTFDNSL